MLTFGTRISPFRASSSLSAPNSGAILQPIRLDVTVVGQALSGADLLASLEPKTEPVWAMNAFPVVPLRPFTTKSGT